MHKHVMMIMMMMMMAEQQYNSCIIDDCNMKVMTKVMTVENCPYCLATSKETARLPLSTVEMYLGARGRSVVVSTHDLGWAASQCDLLCLLAGRVVCYGPPDRVLDAELLADAYGGALLEIGGVRILAPEGHHHH